MAHVTTELVPTDTTATTVSAAQQLWEKAIERLQDEDDSDVQLAMLRLFADLDDDDLPIPEITEVLLTETSTLGVLMVSDGDDLWTEGLEVIERAPDRIPVERVVEVLRNAFEEGVLGGMERKVGIRDDISY